VSILKRVSEGSQTLNSLPDEGGLIHVPTIRIGTRLFADFVDGGEA
jgi:hypothetical protein